MNSAITKLFSNLESCDHSAQQDALVAIVMVLERGARRPEADDGLSATLLTDNLLTLNLSPKEVEQLISAIFMALNSPNLSRSTKMSLFWGIGKFADFSHGEDLLQFVSVFVSSFDEQEAFSSVALLTGFLNRFRHDRHRLKDLLEKHNVLSLIEGMRPERSNRLRESVMKLVEFVRNRLET